MDFLEKFQKQILEESIYPADKEINRNREIVQIIKDCSLIKEC